MIGDIVGKPGQQIVVRALPGLRIRENLDLVIANAENVADGSGITPAIYRSLISCGVDCITLGDHIYKRQEIEGVLKTEHNIVKPANFPDESPGKEWAMVFARDKTAVGVFSLLGRVFMRPVDCPFKAADRVLAKIPSHVKVRFLDFHAEATSDMQSMGRYLDGKVTAVLGTHTHVTTADETIYPGGSAFQCDVGMTGPHESILGRRIDRVLSTTVSFVPSHFQVATGDVRLVGTIVEVDTESGRATGIRRIVVREEEAQDLEFLASQPERRHYSSGAQNG